MSLNNTSDYQPWANPDFIQNILKRSLNDETIKVRSITSEAAVPPGENFMSNVFRVIVELTRGPPGRKVTENKYFVFKVALKQDGLPDHPDVAQNEFKAEIEMMRSTLVEMHEILNEKDHRLSPGVLYTQLGNPSFLILEDMLAAGFHVVNRQIGLDLNHSRLVMRKLAKFHASSVALYEKDPDFIKFYQTLDEAKHADKNTVDSAVRFVTKGFKILAAEMLKWPELDVRYSEKIIELSKVHWEKRAECLEPKEKEFNAFNHGDPWVNNLMFRYNDEGEVVDQVFLDFQISAWRSPAADLHYFLTTSLMDDVYLHHYNNLIIEYLNTLTETMLRIKCRTNPPTTDVIQVSLRDREFLAILYSIIVLPLVLDNNTTARTLSDLFNRITDEARGMMYNNEHYRQIITRRLKDWFARGLLDV
ncbi:uncharacterized protein [Venturia canescens]|uniref:uncharacterized protein n=1 Tax=Venturia canescens TaxID=32260 RepID=UPI001C9BD71D|nr:uncharacterized protein LOC122412431 [Venturia canescens]